MKDSNSDFYLCDNMALSLSLILSIYAHTVVWWEKLVVGNIHEIKICGKNFSS